MDDIVFHGLGLHTGKFCSLRLARAEGPVHLVGKLGRAPRSALEVVRADRGVKVRTNSAGLELDLVEHLLGALCGLGIELGVSIEVQGSEVPLLDGGAADITRALLALGAPRAPPSWRVVRGGEVDVDGSRYVFEPADRVEVEVEVEFGPPISGVERASWDGCAESFVETIAPARTFGVHAEADQLRRRGRAGHVDPRAVIVFEADGTVMPPGEPPKPGELARHKLLDLLGDAYLFGGRLEGRLVARRPGHARNHYALRQALQRGLVAPIAEDRLSHPL